MNINTVLKVISDESWMKILSLLLKYNYCVGALAKETKLSKLKVLYEAELLINNKRAYFMYYSVNQSVLNKL